LALGYLQNQFHFSVENPYTSALWRVSIDTVTTGFSNNASLHMF
jgi:hypothetical protein